MGGDAEGTGRLEVLGWTREELAGRALYYAFMYLFLRFVFIAFYLGLSLDRTATNKVYYSIIIKQ